MKNFPLRLECDQELTEWANKNGLSLNAAINYACRQFLDREAGRLGLLERENEELRQKIINVALGKTEAAIR